MSTDDELSAIVERFVAAEDALTKLRARSEVLTRAANEMDHARSTMASSTAASLEALEATREQLRERILADQEVATARTAVDAELAELLAVVRHTLDALRAIDPARFATELAELRRDGSDNAAEVRELRRLTTDVQRDSRETSDKVSALTTAAASTDSKVDGVDAQVVNLAEQLARAEAAMSEAQEGIAAALARQSRRLTEAVVIAGVGAIAAAISIFA